MENNYNKLTPGETERLAILAEECGEVIQAIGKVLRHGYASIHPKVEVSNRTRLEQEVADVVIAVTLMLENNDINEIMLDSHTRTKVKKWKNGYAITL